MNEEKNVEQLYPLESPLSLCNLPHETEEDRHRLAQAVEIWIRRTDEDKWPRALQWFQNYAYLRRVPFAFFEWNGHSLAANNEAINPNVKFLIPQTISNYLSRPYDGTVSMFTSNRPYPLASPKSNLPEDEDAAKASAAIVETLWENPLRMQSKMRQLVSGMCLTDTCALEVVYEDTPGIQSDEDHAMESEVNVALGRKATDKPQHEKDVCVRVLSGFNLGFDPGASADPDSINWVMTQVIEDKGVVEEMFSKDEDGYYPENAAQMVGGKIEGSCLFWLAQVRDLITRGDLNWSGFTNRTAGDNELVLTTFHCRPNPRFPKGRTIQFGGGQLLYCGDARAFHESYPERWNTITLFRYREFPDSVWGEALLSPLLPKQRRINAIDALQGYYREQVAIGQRYIPRSARIPENYMTRIPGQDIYYSDMRGPQSKPTPVENPPFPNQLLEERAQLMKDIEREAGINEVLSGDNPSGVRAGVMLDALKREALQSKDAIFQNFEEGIEQVTQNILIEVATNYQPDKFSTLMKRMQVAARDVSYLAFDAFTTADLRDNTIVKFDIRSKMMTTPEAEKERAIEALQYSRGLLEPEQSRKILVAAGIGDFGSSKDAQVLAARRMIAMIRNNEFEGLQPMPGIHKAMIMVEVFADACLHATFTNLSEQQQRALLQLHDTYAQMAAQEQANAMMLQAEMQRMGAEAQASGPQVGGPAEG